MEGIFVIGSWNLKRSDFDNSRLKTFFCEYWTSIKSKITMACVYKEYQIQKNGTGENNTVKCEVFIRGKRIKSCWGEERSLLGGIF